MDWPCPYGPTQTHMHTQYTHTHKETVILDGMPEYDQNTIHMYENIIQNPLMCTTNLYQSLKKTIKMPFGDMNTHWNFRRDFVFLITMPKMSENFCALLELPWFTEKKDIGLPPLSAPSGS